MFGSTSAFTRGLARLAGVGHVALGRTVHHRLRMQVATSTVLASGAGLAVVTQASAQSPTQLTSCTFAALDSAVASGGTIDYEQDCTVG